jgi:hypothetical protein
MLHSSGTVGQAERYFHIFRAFIVGIVRVMYDRRAGLPFLVHQADVGQSGKNIANIFGFSCPTYSTSLEYLEFNASHKVVANQGI